ncbi:MAG: hypothetical protein ABIN80_13665 [Dyadobacter sp.]|uniref:hypothetical protein n=1 Tax=Dyadobacter sp. TaxID=1914288 RepID=UPI003265E8B2
MGNVFKIIARSFAPFKRFGRMVVYGDFYWGEYEGDDRTFSTSLKVSSRVSSSLHLTLNPLKNLGDIVQSHPTRGFGMTSKITSKATEYLADTIGTIGETFNLSGIVERREREYHEPSRIDRTGHTVTSKEFSYGTSDVRKEGENIIIQQSYHGSIPLVDVLAGDIDVTNNIVINLEVVDNKVTSMVIKGSLVGDRFPWAEVLLVDSLNNVIFLHTFKSDWGPNTGPVLALLGDMKTPMGNYTAKVHLDKMGVINKVSVPSASTIVNKNSMYSVEQWNARFYA